MVYRAVGDRCAVDLSSLDLSLPNADVVERLVGLGFRVIDVDLVGTAERMVGQAAYRRGAKLSDAPLTFDCSSFVKWLYAERGIWIPRRSPHQFRSSVRVDDEHIGPGDLVFTGGQVCAPSAVNLERVGHVGFICPSRRVIHAAPGGIARASLDDWIADPLWRGARRIIPAGHSVLTLCIPPSLDIETSDDVRWTILETFDWGAR